MNHDEVFLEAIRAAPDEDTPRFVYADWLEDHGQSERAEFIRLQLARARRLDLYSTDGNLEARERELLGEYHREWAEPIRGWVNAWEFRRGFIESVTVRPEVFLAHADDLFRFAPIRHVAFLTARLQLAPPHLIHPSSAPLLPNLAMCPHLARLSSINFWCNGIGEEGVTALAASPHLSRLTSLDLTLNGVGDTGLQVLAAASAFSLLTSRPDPARIPCPAGTTCPHALQVFPSPPLVPEPAPAARRYHPQAHRPLWQGGPGA